MERRIKIGANETCPCWSGYKYKKCCKGIVDWNAIFANGDGYVAHLSARGRNILFSQAIFDALQLDNENIPDLAAYKRAFTKEAVRKIHQAILELWPPDTDLKKVLRRRSGGVSGFYIGDYETKYLEQSLIRHCLYADRIILADPFPHPYTIAPKFNPLFEPEQHRAQTLKNVNRFLRFLPWIDAGLVEFTRTPDDLDRQLRVQTIQHAQEQGADPHLEAALTQTLNRMSERHYESRSREHLLLSAPDSYIRKMFREAVADGSPADEDEFIRYVNKQRDLDPDFLEPLGGPEKAQLYTLSAGGTIEMAKTTAEMTGSYLFTDLLVRWEMLKKERNAMAPETKAWTPFARAVQEADLSFLNNIDLSVALRLRTEGRLEGVRGVLRKAWKADLTEEEFDEQNAIYLAENLRESVREAESEWHNIKTELAKLGFFELAGNLAAAGPLIASGHALWLAGATVATVAGHSLVTHRKRKGFEKRFPASFFIDLTDKSDR